MGHHDMIQLARKKVHKASDGPDCFKYKQKEMESFGKTMQDCKALLGQLV